MEKLNESQEDMDFNAMIWAECLKGTGNSKYQNKFYDRQAEKILDKYAKTYQSG